MKPHLYKPFKKARGRPRKYPKLEAVVQEQDNPFHNDPTMMGEEGDPIDLSPILPPIYSDLCEKYRFGEEALKYEGLEGWVVRRPIKYGYWNI